jgi:hypothetical protein
VIPEPVRFDGDVAVVKAGELLQIDFLWRSLRDHPGVFTVSVDLEDERSRTLVSRDSEPVDRMYPSWMWSAGELIRDQLRLPIPSRAQPGRYRLSVILLERGRPVPLLDAAGWPAGGYARLVDVDIVR